MTQDERLRYLAEQFKIDAGAYKSLQVGNSREEQRTALRSLMNIRMPKPLVREVLDVQDDYLRQRAEEKGIVTLADIPTVAAEYGTNAPLSDKLSIWQGDITRLQVDAIVNAANSQMLRCFQPMHACIDKTIENNVTRFLFDRMRRDRII